MMRTIFQRGNNMNYNLKSTYSLTSNADEIRDFIETHKNTLEILNTIEPKLIGYFPNTEFSLELCDDLQWTTESKLLVNVHVDEEMFFNRILNHFNEIYKEIDYLIEDIFCPIVLFPSLANEKYDKMTYDCAINLVARTAYFNSDFDKNFQREMSLRDIPKSQKVEEIIEYCKKHPSPDISDIVYDLQLDLFDVDDIIDELESNGEELNVQY